MMPDDIREEMIPLPEEIRSGKGRRGKECRRTSGWHVCSRQHQTEAMTNDIHRTCRQMSRFTIDNTLRKKKQKAGARHELKENMAGLSATSISLFCFHNIM